MRKELLNAGGGFYEKRETLKEEKSELSAELRSVEREISELCTNILPFSLVPNQLKEIKEKDCQKIKKIFNKGLKKIY